jgi:hypothetical protein
MIHIDRNPKHLPFYVEIAIYHRNKMVDIEYFGFFSNSEAKQFIKQNPNLIYL